MAASKSSAKVDVLVVGSGAAGSVIAAEAARAGKQVLVLEAGPARQPTDLVSSQIWARRLKWSGAPVEESGNLPVGHGFNAGWGTGGSALHHYAVWPRLHPDDFRVRSRFDRGLDWPLDYDELAPWYDRVQQAVGLSGDAQQERWRPAGKPYPMPPLPVFAQGQVIAEGFRKSGMHTAPIPMAINSIPYQGRPPCLYDGWCDAGCPIGALANPLATYLGWAVKAGARIQNHATVVRVVHDASGRVATGVEYCDAEGKRHRVDADTVVLAAFAVQTARLLLASTSDKHPRGLSNGNGLVGRYLMTHPATSIYGLFDRETQPHLGPTGGQLICHDRYDSKQRDDAFGAYQWLIANALKPNDLLGITNTRPDITGDELEAFMQKAVRHMGAMVFVGEDIAQRDNRVSLSDRRDSYGVALAHATHNVLPETEKLCEQAVAEGLDIFRAAGSAEPWAGPRFGMHIMGGTVMGRDPAESVCDAYGRLHEMDNVYVAGSGLFPSSGAVNPTFTIHALALRAADHLFSG